MGDTCEYLGPDMKTRVSNAVVCVRSLLWPGAYSFYYRGEVKQVYLGNGHKYEQTASYYPVNPPTVLADPEEYGEGPEPTPLEEPVVEEKPAEDEVNEDGAEPEENE